MSDFVIIGGLPLVSHKGSSLVVESAEIVRATEKPKSCYSQSPQWTSMNGSNQFMLQLSSAPLHSPRPICTHPRPYIWRQQTATRWRTQTLDAYGREHLEPKSIGSQTATLAADQSRRRQIQAITATAHRCCALPHEGLSLSTTPPPLSLSRFLPCWLWQGVTGSLALSSSAAGCKKFRGKVKAMAPMFKTNSNGPQTSNKHIYLMTK